MALTESTMRLSPGTAAPDFELPDVISGKAVRLSSFAEGRATLVMFICQHCPYVKHVEQELARMARDYATKPLAIIAISSNDVATQPGDRPQLLKVQAETVGFTFPYLYAESQSVAKAYDAACTPDLFLFNTALKLAYRGQLDDSRPGSGIPVTGRDPRAAIDAVLEGRPVSSAQRPSIGCNIKWKAGR